MSDLRYWLSREVPACVVVSTTDLSETRVELVPATERDRLRGLLAAVLAMHDVGMAAWTDGDWATIERAQSEVENEILTLERQTRTLARRCEDAANAAAVLGWDEDMIAAIAAELAELRPACGGRGRSGRGARR